MRPLGLLLLLAACTVDNPAFFVTATEGASGGATTDATPPGTGSSDPSTAGTEAPTGPGPASTTDGSTTDATTTTGPPGTSTTDATTDATTAVDTTTESDTDPNACLGIDDPLGPLIPLLTAQGLFPIDTPACANMQGKPLTGMLTVSNTGFSVVEHPNCPLSQLPSGGVHIPVPLPQLPPIKDVCVGLRYQIHPEYFECTLAEVVVTHDNKPAFFGSFGVAPFTKGELEVSYTALGTCDCPGCCGDGPDPDRYHFALPSLPPVPEDGSAMFKHAGHNFRFMNLRSHIHAPDCLTDDMPRADWLHFDWMAYRVP
jgi:hypothetical protein